jgi:uncharacterized protein YdgA (DUF945 family)
MMTCRTEGLAMKKTGTWSIVALVVLYAAAAWLMGYSIEGNIDSAIAQLHERAPFVTVSERRFKRGWFRSEQDLTLELFRDTLGSMPGRIGTPGGAIGPLRFTVHSEIIHGPICGVTCIGRARIESRFVLEGEAGQKLATLFGGAEPLQAQTLLGLFGGTTTTVISPAFPDKKLDDGSTISWGGLTATTASDAQADVVTLHGAAPRVALMAADGKRFEATSLSIDSNSRRALRSLYAGDGGIAIGKLSFVAGPTGVTINDLRSESHGTVSDGFMTLKLETGTSTITTEPLTLTGVHVDFTLRHLDLDSLEAFLAALRDTNQPPSTTPAQRAQAAQQVFAQQGLALLSHAPELGLDRISAAAAGGEVLLTGTIRLAGTTPADFAAGANPATLISKLEADLDLSADDAFLKALPGPGATLEPRVQSLVASGLVTRTGGKLRTKIAYRNGQTTFNGQAFQPPPPPAGLHR